MDYDAVRELRDIWHREDFGEHIETEAFHAQAREVAELADVCVIAAVEDGRPAGFAQVETHDGGSEVTQVFVRPERRGAGLGRRLTARAIGVGADAAPYVWISAERDGRPRRLYERLGFRAVIETGVAILLPPWTGRPDTLLCRAPLRTRACPFPSTRLKQAPQARRRAEVPGDCGCGSRRV